MGNRQRPSLLIYGVRHQAIPLDLYVGIERRWLDVRFVPAKGNDYEFVVRLRRYVSSQITYPGSATMQLTTTVMWHAFG